MTEKEMQRSLWAGSTGSAESTAPTRSEVAEPETGKMTIGEAASTLGVSISTLRNWDRQGKLSATRHPMNSYRLYARDTILKLRDHLDPGAEAREGAVAERLESRFDIPFIAPMALAEKQIQQSYRPYIQVHKWFARRPGTLFRALLLCEFGDERPLRHSFFESHFIKGLTVLDPFIGGGTPVLEANRIGINVIGCDINPMSTWIVQQELASLDTAAFRSTANALIRKVRARLQRYYTTRCQCCESDATVKYFIWVKQLPCPQCTQPIELFPGYLVASNARHPNHVFFCPVCRDLFELSDLPNRGDEVTCSSCGGTWINNPIAHRNRYTCSHCSYVGRYPDDLVQHGPPAHSLFAIEYHCEQCKPNHKGRFFKAPTADDLRLFSDASIATRTKAHNTFLPDDEIPAGDETTRLHRWGYQRFSDLFNPRQLLALTELASAISAVPDRKHRHALATVFSDFLRYQNMLGRYDTYALKCQDIFSVHGFPVGLIQCENNVLGIPRVGTGGYLHFIEKYIAAKKYNEEPFEIKLSKGRKIRIPTSEEYIGATFSSAEEMQNDVRAACIRCSSVEDLTLAPNSIDAVLTDPPYFDNVQYAELMDFCYVWLRRLINGEVSFFSARSTRAEGELTGNKTAGRDLDHFCDGLSRVYCASARALKPGGLFAFTYHHNDVDAYLPVAVALLDAGLQATASLPCPAEMAASLHIAKTGSSVVDTIICSRKAAPGHKSPEPPTTPLFATLREQTAQLRSGGIKPTEGDVRCMLLGLATVRVVNEQHSCWDSQQPAKVRLSLTRTEFARILDQAGGIDAAVKWALAVPNDAKDEAATGA